MSSIFDMLTQQLGGENLQKISRQLGTDEKTTGTAMAAAIPALLGALSRNAAKPEGAEALAGALRRDHDGSLLNNLQSHLSNPQAGPGEGILQHILGNRRNAVEAGLSKTSGIDSGSMSQLMSMLAPVVMGALGKAQRGNNLDVGGLQNLLEGERRTVEAKEPQALGFIGKLLDSDGDGDFDMGDVAKKGLGMLGNLFRK